MLSIDRIDLDFKTFELTNTAQLRMTLDLVKREDNS